MAEVSRKVRGGVAGRPPLRRGHGRYFCLGCARTRPAADMRYYDPAVGEWVAMERCKACQSTKARSLV